MSILDAFHTVFGDSTDAIDAAGDAEQARIVQAIDLINQSFSGINSELDAGRTEYINTVKNTINQMKQEILAGNADVAEKLKQGLDKQIQTLSQTYDLGYSNLENSYNIIEDKLMSAAGTARGDISGALGQARTDLTSGRDNALTALRSSLTSSLNSLSQGTDRASQAISSSLQRTRQTYAPYIAAGQKAIARAEQLTNDPQAQLDYVQNNPFFSAMQETARDQLFANKAAAGRLGSGETLDQLDKNTLLLGEQLVGNAVNRNMGISGQGLQAGSLQTGADTSLTNLLANIFSNEGLNAALLNQNYGNTVAGVETGTASALAGNEMRAGEGLADIAFGAGQQMSNIGAEFTNMLNNNTLNLGMAANSAQGNYWGALANLVGNQASQMSGLTGQGGFAEAGANQDYRNNWANSILAQAGMVAPMLVNLGTSEANEAVGEQAAQRQGFNDILSLVGLAMTGFNTFGGGGTTTGGTPMNSYGPMAGGYQSGYNTFGGYAPPSFYNPSPSLVQFSPLNLGG